MIRLSSSWFVCLAVSLMCVTNAQGTLVSSFRSLPFAAIMSLVPLNKSKISTNCILHRVQTPNDPLGYHFFGITSGDQRWFLAEYVSSLYDKAKHAELNQPRNHHGPPGILKPREVRNSRIWANWNKQFNKMNSWAILDLTILDKVLTTHQHQHCWTFFSQFASMNKFSHEKHCFF